MDELRSWWEVPSIAFFCQVFREPLKLPEFDIEELEESILLSATPEGSETLTSLLCILLRGCLGRRDIEHYNCDVYLKKLLGKRWCERSTSENPMAESDFRQLHARTKVEILYELCHWRLLSDDSCDLVKDYDGDALRISPIGTDEKGSSYWYFVGTRLYKETPAPPTGSSHKKRSDLGLDRKASALSKKMHASKKKRKGARKKKILDKQLMQCEKTKQAEEEDIAAAQWQLACSTVDEWQALAESFRNSKARCERDLHKRLTDEFLISIPKIIEEKERIMRKKLLEMAPKRTSSRLQHKKQEYEEQIKIIEQLELAEKLELQQMEEQQRLADEEDRRVAAARAREERLRLKEERAQRVLLREMRASLIAEGKDIPPELLALDSPAPAAPDGAETALPLQPDPPAAADHDNDDLDTKLSKVLMKVRRHKNAWPFLEPVPETLAPDYYTVILKPMDLSKMETKLKKKEYSCRQEFEADFNRMIENCQLYNGPSSDYTMLAVGLREAFLKVVGKCFAPKKPRAHSTSNVSAASTGPAGGPTTQAVNGHAELAAALALSSIRASGRHSPAPKAQAAAAPALLPTAGSLPTCDTSGRLAPSQPPAPSPGILSGKGHGGSGTLMTAGTLLTAIACTASMAASGGLGRSLAASAPSAAPRPLVIKALPPVQAPPRVPSTFTATVGQQQQPQLMLIVDPRAQQQQQLAKPKVIGPGFVAQQQLATHGIAPSGTHSAAAPAAAAAATTGAWPQRQVVIMPRPATAAAAAVVPLAGWRTVASATSSTAAYGTLRPPAGIVAATAVTAAAAATAAPVRLPSSDGLIIVNSGGGSATAATMPGLPTASLVNGAIRGAAPNAVAAAGNALMTLSATPGQATAPPSKITVLSPGIICSASPNSDGAVGLANGQRPVHSSKSAAAAPPPAVAGSSVGSLLVLKEGWLPSHLNLPGGGSTASAGSPVEVPSVASRSTGSAINESNTKRPADAADRDTAAKRLAVSTSSASLSSSSLTFR